MVGWPVACRPECAFRANACRPRDCRLLAQLGITAEILDSAPLLREAV